jgi:hypothetical protein
VGGARKGLLLLEIEFDEQRECALEVCRDPESRCRIQRVFDPIQLIQFGLLMKCIASECDLFAEQVGVRGPVKSADVVVEGIEQVGGIQRRFEIPLANGLARCDEPGKQLSVGPRMCGRSGIFMPAEGLLLIGEVGYAKVHDNVDDFRQGFGLPASNDRAVERLQCVLNGVVFGLQSRCDRVTFGERLDSSC